MFIDIQIRIKFAKGCKLRKAKGRGAKVTKVWEVLPYAVSREVCVLSMMGLFIEASYPQQDISFLFHFTFIWNGLIGGKFYLSRTYIQWIDARK